MPDNAWVKWRLVCTCAIALGIVGATSAPAETPAGEDRRTLDVDTSNRLSIAKAIAPDDDSPDNRKLADRPDIQAAYDAYRRDGGLAPKYRFAHAFALTSGFSGGPLAGLIDDAMSKQDIERLKAHPAAFDLVCERSPAAGEAPSSAATDPSASAPLRFSVDVPAGLWRSSEAYIQTMHIGEKGKLVTKWHVDLEHPTWGLPIYDRISRSYEEVVTSMSYASKTGARTSVHATCKLAPYSKLFGAGG